MNIQKSVEPYVAELGNGWLKEAGVDYKLEQASLNFNKIKLAISKF